MNHRGGVRSALIRWAAAVALMAALPGSARSIPIEKLMGVLSGGRALEVVAGQALVYYSTAPAQAQAQAAGLRAGALAARGASDQGEVAGTGWRLVRLPEGMTVAEGLSWLKGLPGVEGAEPNHVLRPNRMPNDPKVSSQYALYQVNAFAAWEFETGSKTQVTIAVVDSGIDGTNAELSGKLTAASQYFNPAAGGAQAADQPPTPACNHATRVAGLAAASTDNGTGIAGMSWGANLLSLKVFRDVDCGLAEDGCTLGACATSDAAVAAAIAYAQTLHNTAGIGKVVINISLGDPAACSNPIKAAIANAVAAGLVVVAAAGNDGGGVMAPGNCPGAIPVGATDQSNAVAFFSSRGPELAANGLVAPGVAVYTTSLNDGFASPNGTSFASPIVAGAAALIWSARPDFGPDQIKATLRNSTDNIGVAAMAAAEAGGQRGARSMGDSSGAGRLNAFKALRLAVKGTLADFEGDRKAIAFPNPFRLAGQGIVTLTVPTELQGAQMKVKVFTAAGQLVRELSGTTWDGKNKYGQTVGSGVYFFVVSTDKGAAAGQLTIIR
ncbi:MAG: S8 family peptidase [Elusimicrobia bacterium]|nr:S8 family peptidase [Elusimicrobiota bacterium]